MSRSTPPRNYGDIPAAAEVYGVSTKTIRRWIAAGFIDAYRVGPRLLRVDLEADQRLVRPLPTAGRAS